MQTVPYHLRQKAARLIAGKASLLARIDGARSERDVNITFNSFYFKNANIRATLGSACGMK